jgi:hypothetical protein
MYKDSIAQCIAKVKNYEESFEFMEPQDILKQL